MSSDGDGGRLRWMPKRAGIVNVWRYVDEVFEFHRGRLLLRGPNGSGKSMALELLFPFLLDARADRSRLSSAAKSRGGLHGRLMGGFEISSRVGFLWAEFERGDQYFTVGVRLRAGKGSSKVDKDWFTTSSRPGVDLRLLDENRTPLSRVNLKEAVEASGSGRVYASAEDYRAAVRATLFPELSAEQYDALLAALLALRVEKVSQNISPEKLGEILTASLPPLDEREVAGLAEGFEKLDRRKEELGHLRHQFHFASDLAKHLRAYARNILARESSAVRAAESTRDRVTRTEREARAQLEAARDALAELKAFDSTAERTAESLEATIAALQTSDAYREGAQLDPLREQTKAAAQAHATAQRELDERAKQTGRAQTNLDRTTAALRTQLEKTRVSTAALVSLADELGASSISAKLDIDDPDRGEDQLVAWLGGRDARVGGVRTKIELRDRAKSLRERCERDVARERDTVDELIARRLEAENEQAASSLRFAERLQTWANNCRALPVDMLVKRLANVDEPSAAHETIDEVLRATSEALAREQALFALDRKRVERERTLALEEHSRLENGEEQPPEAPPGRRDRSQVPGAALWSLVDFHEQTAPETRNRIEAALGSAGLLDAWVTREGTVHLADDEADAILTAQRFFKTVQGQRLSSILEPVARSKVDRSVVEAVLESIALRDSALTESLPAAIGLDGSFRLAQLTGMSPPKEACYIGAFSRERERNRRIAELNHLVAQHNEELTELRRQIEGVDQRLGEIVAERDRRPTGADVLKAVAVLRECEIEIATAERRRREAESERHDADVALREAERELEHVAASSRLPMRTADLDKYVSSLSSLSGLLRGWVRLCRDYLRLKAEMSRQREESKTAGALQVAAEGKLEEGAREHHRLRTKLDVLDQSIGEKFRNVRTKLEKAEVELKACKEQRRLLASQRESQARKVGEFEATVTSATTALAKAEDGRAQCHRRFATAITDGLMTDGGIDVPDALPTGVTAILTAARQLKTRLGDIAGTTRSIARANNAVGEALHKASQELGGRVDLAFEESVIGEWSLLRASSQGVRQTMPQLVDSLASELETAENELEEGEQRLFDETLTGSVRRHVASRIRLANELVDRLNEQLGAVKTDVAGVGIRLRWIVDSPNDSLAAVRTARELLLRDPADLSDAERDSLYDFFRSRIDLVRTGEDSLAGWDAQLVEALDYRSWHRFQLQVGHASWDGYKDATTSRWAKLSTGERSIALHLPMLASIVAHYQTGSGGCPRLIVLDELFAGVDPSNRAKLLGMLVTWDLDAVFTSDNEWCSYATLDGIAIHHIHAEGHEAGDPVTSSRFVWNGRIQRPSPVTTDEQ